MFEGIAISAADLGTNTLKVSHAKELADGTVDYILHDSNTVRLGEGIETTGMVASDRFEAVIRYLREQEQLGRELGTTVFIGVATEVLRVASNGPDLLNRIAGETSWKITVISGDEEARLTYVGLREFLPDEQMAAIVDIGGGSTEIIVAENGRSISQQSIPIGSGRMADRHFRTDPPGMEATAAVLEDAMAGFGQLLGALPPIQHVLFAGGSGLFINAMIELLDPGAEVTITSIDRLLQHLSVFPASSTVEAIGIPLARAKVFPASVAVALAFLNRCHVNTATGVPSGIRMGIINEYLAARHHGK